MAADGLFAWSWSGFRANYAVQGACGASPGHESRLGEGYAGDGTVAISRILSRARSNTG